MLGYHSQIELFTLLLGRRKQQKGVLSEMKDMNRKNFSKKSLKILRNYETQSGQ